MRLRNRSAVRTTPVLCENRRHMNEPARGPNRPMASGRKAARVRTGHPNADPGPTLERVRPHIPWTRRIGIVIALLALGGTVVLAGGFGRKDAPSSSGARSATPSGAAQPATDAVRGPKPKTAPVLATPLNPITSKRIWNARVTITATGIARASLTLRVFRNDRAVMDVPVRRGTSMSVPNIPLKTGINQIAAVFVSPAGEGPRSNTVTLTVDDVGPQIDVTQPSDHAVINAPSVTLTAGTEPKAAVVITNAANKNRQTATAAADGQFSLIVPLVLGLNALDITATDALGNVGRLRLSVTRGTGVADAQLVLSKSVFRLRQIPTAFDVTLLVMDANGAPVEGATVTFSLSPPGLPTSTYQATTTAGHAGWKGATLSDGLQAGDGFVTARVTLADGSTLQRTAAFTVR